MIPISAVKNSKDPKKKSNKDNARHNNKSSSRKNNNPSKYNKNSKKKSGTTSKRSSRDEIKLSDTYSEKSSEERFWFVRTVDETFNETKSNHSGLTDTEAENRLKKYGENTIAKDDGFKWWKSLVSNFNSLIIYVLLAAALISLFFDHMLEFVVVMAIIFITGFLGFVQEYSASKSIEALSKLTAKKVTMLRSGKKKEIFAEYLVPGDVVLLSRGMIVPADLRVVESKGLTADESILTGESVLKHKITEPLEDQETIIADQENMLFSGTSITGGSGKAVVVETGIDSEIGKISEQLHDIEREKSPLQKKVDVMSKNVSYIVLTIALIFSLILLGRSLETYQSLILVAAVVVGGIPESFPLALTLTLTNGVKKMASKNAIVKDLGSVETLGTTTVVCTDKTGTLTENKMSATRVYVPGENEFEVKGHGYEPSSKIKRDGKILTSEDLAKYRDIFKTCILCNDADLMREKGEWGLKGEPTEGSLLTLAKSSGFDDVVIREENKRVYEIPFDPADKFMVTVNRNPEKGSSHKAYLKGAVEKVLEKCSHVQKGGKIVKLTPAYRNKIMKKVDRYTSQALRVMALASKGINVKKKDSIDGSSLNKGFIFHALVGIEDPIREDVYGAVKECREAGVGIKIVTGDHKTTASAIGKELGIISNPEKEVVLGTEIDSMDDDDLDKRISDVVIFARTTPEHKLRIVSSLQRIGEVVGMTGDGVNDAPALKKADIGISMGKGGTEVARESSNLVLADDNFATIVNAIREGRTIYSNVRRNIFFMLTVNFTEMALIVVAVAMGFFAPLTALMMLFINIISKMFPAMALSMEDTHDKVMQQQPRDPKEPLLSGYMLSKILSVAPVMFIGSMLLFIWLVSYEGVGEDLARTIIFSTVIMFELFHVLNARSLHSTAFSRDFFANKFVLPSIAVSLGLMLVAIYTPFGQMIFETVPLEMERWLLILVISVQVLVASEIMKLVTYFEFKEQSNLQGVDVQLK